LLLLLDIGHVFIRLLGKYESCFNVQRVLMYTEVTEKEEERKEKNHPTPPSEKRLKKINIPLHITIQRAISACLTLNFIKK